MTPDTTSPNRCAMMLRSGSQTARNFLVLVLCLAIVGCRHPTRTNSAKGALPDNPKYKPLTPNSSPQLKNLIDASIGQAGVTTSYDPNYVGIAYPNGDVPLNTGVCSDVVVRAFRKVGIDLQK